MLHTTTKQRSSNSSRRFHGCVYRCSCLVVVSCDMLALLSPRNNETGVIDDDDDDDLSKKIEVPKLRKLYYCFDCTSSLSTTATSCKYNNATLPFQYHNIKCKIKDMSSVHSLYKFISVIPVVGNNKGIRRERFNVPTGVTNPCASHETSYPNLRHILHNNTTKLRFQDSFLIRSVY